MLQRRAKYQE